MRREARAQHTAGTGAAAARPHPLKDVLAGALLVCLAVTFFWPVFSGRVLVPGEGVFIIDPLFAKDRRPEVSDWQNILLVPDLLGVIYPWRWYAASSAEAGFIPLWNPYSACGVPFLANNQSAVLNPTNLLVNGLFTPPIGQTVFGLLTCVIAALGAFGLVRSLGGTRLGGFLAGLTFALSGFIFLWLGYPLAAAAALLPALLWATHHLVMRPSVRSGAVVGALIGWQLLSGHLSTSVQTIAFWAVFSAYLIRRVGPLERGSAGRRAAAALLLALFFGGGLAAAQLLPLKEYFDLSSIAHKGRSRWSTASRLESARSGLLGDLEFLRSIAPVEAALLFNPEAQGNPAFREEEAHSEYGNYAEQASYPGMLALLALITIPFLRPSNGHARFFAASGWIVFAILLHLPLFNTVTYLPVLRLAAPQRMRFIFSLCAAASLGLVVPDWLRCREAEGRTLRRSLWLAAAGLACLSAALGALELRHLGPLLPELPTELVVVRILKLFAPALTAIGAALVFAALCRRPTRSPRAIAFPLLLLALGDLLAFTARWHPMCPRDKVLPLLRPIASARGFAGYRRMTGPPRIFHPNLSVPYRCYDTRLYDPISVARYASLAEAASGMEPGAGPSVFFAPEKPAPLLEALTGTTVRWEMDARYQVSISPLLDVLPRAYVSAGLPARTAREALEATLGRTDPFARTVVEADFTPSPGPARVVPAAITHYSPHQVTVSCNAERRGWLVLTDTFFPGWRATVDGKHALIRPANYAFRAVAVPAGASTVEFTYDPASYRVGLFLSLLTLSALTALAAAGRPSRLSRRRRPRGRGSRPHWTPQRR